MLDTNVVVSALLSNAAPRRLLDAAINGQIELFSSKPLLDELRRVLQRPKMSLRIERAGMGAIEAVDAYRRAVLVETPTERLSVVRDDPDDDRVLECALAAAAECIASGDKHLLALGAFWGIPILRSATLLEKLVGSAGDA